LRVVDFARSFEAGLLLHTESLAWLGSEVFMIENPGAASRPPACNPAIPTRPLVFSPVQRQQEISDAEFESPLGLDIVQGSAHKGPTSGGRREHGARHIERVWASVND